MSNFIVSNIKATIYIYIYILLGVNIYQVYNQKEKICQKFRLISVVQYVTKVILTRRLNKKKKDLNIIRRR